MIFGPLCLFTQSAVIVSVSIVPSDGAVNIASMGLFGLPWFVRYLVMIAVMAVSIYVLRPQLKMAVGLIRKRKK